MVTLNSGRHNNSAFEPRMVSHSSSSQKCTIDNARSSTARRTPTETLPMARNVDALVQHQLRHGEKAYVRRRDLPGLLHLFPAEIATLDHTNPETILQKLTRALKAEGRRGRQGHWRYSLSRHIALAQALRAERQRKG